MCEPLARFYAFNWANDHAGKYCYLLGISNKHDAHTTVHFNWIEMEGSWFILNLTLIEKYGFYKGGMKNWIYMDGYNICGLRMLHHLNLLLKGRGKLTWRIHGILQVLVQAYCTQVLAPAIDPFAVWPYVFFGAIGSSLMVWQSITFSFSMNLTIRTPGRSLFFLATLLLVSGCCHRFNSNRNNYWMYNCLVRKQQRTPPIAFLWNSFVRHIAPLTIVQPFLCVM